MKSTTAGFKAIMASGLARKYVMKIDITLADDPNPTVLHLTEQDIWQDSFCIDNASSSTSSFDLGSAIIGKCTFTINNIEGDYDAYDFFNASAVVWLGLEGDLVNDTQQYYRMGFYTVDEPQKANGLISLTLLDNMWKFDVPFSELNINYPATAITIVQAICSYCGVSLAGTSANFHGKSFQIDEAPKDAENMNCREMLQYLAMIGCNFCIINDSGYLEIKWYDVNATTSTTDVFERNFSTSFGTDDIVISGVKFVIDKTEYIRGVDGYVLELQNPLITADNVADALDLIWANGYLKDFTLRTFNLNTTSDLAAEVGDKCKIKDYKGNYVYSWITLNTFKTTGHIVQCNAVAPNRTLVKRYSKAVQAAVEVARQAADEQISNYDLAVQMMNNLAVNAMGGYEDFEDIGTGGRVWYLSNMPITKDPTTGVCSFQPNSTVYKKSGSGFFVSRDGGLTWVNGYDITTGELVVNVLDAIGINFDWARGGTLTLGGYGNGNGELSIQNSANVEKVHGDNTGIKVGGTTGSKIFETVDGELKYYYDNVYQGMLKMDAHNYGSQSSPDYQDSLEVKEFDSIRLVTDSDKSEIAMYVLPNNNGGIRLSANTLKALATLLTLGTGTANNSVVTIDGDLDLGGGIKTSGNYTGQNESGLILDGYGNLYQALFDKGILVQKTALNKPLVAWHTWNSGAYDNFELSAGTTTVTFPDINPDYSYFPYIECADNVEPPLLEGIKFNGTNCIVRFTAVTAAQVGSPVSPATSECVIKLQVFGM